MGSIYRPKDRAIWWIAYSRGGKRYAESSESTKKGAATRLLKLREGDIERGVAVTPQMGRLTVDEALDDLLNDYKVNGKKSAAMAEKRIKKHLIPFFGGKRMSNITTADIRAYVAHRQAQGVVHHKTKARIGDVANATVNRELNWFKRAFNLAVQSGRLMHRPHVPMLTENNVRRGFFEAEQLASVLSHLPNDIRPVIEFASITGWRIASEVLPLEWRNVDLKASEVRLDAGTTKNNEARSFPITRDLRTVLEAQKAKHDALKKAGHVVPQVFFRMVADERGGEKKPKVIASFTKVWKKACRAAGCPGRIPHDLRRTAVRSFVRSGIAERVAMQLTGHKTRSVFERYNIVSEGDLREAARRMDLAAAK